MKRVPFAAIVAEYRDNKLREELVGDWGSVVFYRVPAFIVAWALAPLGVTPNQLTAAGALLIPLIALAAWFLTPPQAMVAIAVMGVLFNVLDCADGVLARATGQSSLRGRYLDFAADILYRNTMYAALGLVADRIAPGAAFPWLAVGLCCGLFVTYARVNRVYAEKLFPPQPSGQPGPRSIGDIAFSVLSGIDTLLPFVALLAWAAGVLPYAMLWFLLYTLADTVLEVKANYARAKAIDRA